MSSADGGDGVADKIIDIIRHDDTIEFRERGSDERRTTVVVGQTIRWENKDTRPHRLVSALEIDGKPIFDTGRVRPGEHCQVLIDIDVYSKAGGRPANVISITYRSTDNAGAHGELQVLSAARRSFMAASVPHGSMDVGPRSTPHRSRRRRSGCDPVA